MSRLNARAIARVKKDYLHLKNDPLPYIVAEPLPSNMLEFHYVIKGPEDSLYKDGVYHGKLVFPSDFPFKPPAIFMITPSGRFEPDTRLCLSISDYHPESWNPAWSVSTILTGVLSFMLETSKTVGSIETSKAMKREYALKSIEFNIKSSEFNELFPDLKKEAEEEIKKRMDAAVK